jgi:hypothetical protein
MVQIKFFTEGVWISSGVAQLANPFEIHTPHAYLNLPQGACSFQME